MFKFPELKLKIKILTNILNLTNFDQKSPYFIVKILDRNKTKQNNKKPKTTVIPPNKKAISYLKILPLKLK